MNCIATFKTTSAALMFERTCRSSGINAKLIPVPRKLSSSCGMACEFPCEDKAEVMRLASERKIAVAKYYENKLSWQ